MTKKPPVYGQGSHSFTGEETTSYDPWHERYRYGSRYPHGPKNIGQSPSGTKISDAKIWDEVCDALANAYDVDASNMEVDVEDSIVYLSGTVGTRDEYFKAAQIAWDVGGVDYVQNRLQINYNQKSLS